MSVSSIYEHTNAKKRVRARKTYNNSSVYSWYIVAQYVIIDRANYLRLCILFYVVETERFILCIHRIVITLRNNNKNKNIYANHQKKQQPWHKKYVFFSMYDTLIFVEQLCMIFYWFWHCFTFLSAVFFLDTFSVLFLFFSKIYAKLMFRICFFLWFFLYVFLYQFQCLCFYAFIFYQLMHLKKVLQETF